MTHFTYTYIYIYKGRYRRKAEGIMREIEKEGLRETEFFFNEREKLVVLRSPLKLDLEESVL